MEEKTPKQVHQANLDAVQSTLDYLLMKAKANHLTVGKHMTGKNDKTPVTMSILPIGTNVGNIYSDSGPIIKVQAHNDVWGIEYDQTTEQVVNTVIFTGETRGAGRIRFTHPGTSDNVSEAERLKNLITSVHEWNLA